MKKIFISGVLITVLIGAVYMAQGENNFLVNNAREVFSPAISKAATIEQNIKTSLLSAQQLQKENEILKKEIITRSDLYEYKREIERLQILVGLKNAMEESGNTVSAKVISSAKPDNIIINRGKDSGIKEGDVVLSINGVVGRVSRSGDKFSVVATVLNSRSAVSVRTVRSGIPAIVEGENKGLCKMNFIENADSIAAGDYLETNGGIVFPEGIPVGVVKEVKHENSITYATVAPVVDFTKLFEVLVVCR